MVEATPTTLDPTTMIMQMFLQSQERLDKRDYVIRVCRRCFSVKKLKLGDDGEVKKWPQDTIHFNNC
jgi:hypothetical protein